MIQFRDLARFCVTTDMRESNKAVFFRLVKRFARIAKRVDTRWYAAVDGGMGQGFGNFVHRASIYERAFRVRLELIHLSD